MNTIALSLASLAILVGVHEYGHFWVARRCGVKVLRFSIGFGKSLITWKDKLGTEYSIAAIPLGGYVRMLDEPEPGTVEPAVPVTGDDVSYNALSVWWRIAIAFGGPAANFLLAIVVYWILFVVGTSSVAPMLGVIDPASPIGLAGLAPSEEIVASVDQATHSWQQGNMALAGRR